MYVFQIPFEQIKALSSILDVGSDWEKLAGRMGFSSEEVYTFRQATARGGSPTAEILRVWGSRGYKVEQLFELLLGIQQHRAMQILLPLVDKKYKAALDKKKGKSENQDGVSCETEKSSVVPPAIEPTPFRNELRRNPIDPPSMPERCQRPGPSAIGSPSKLGASAPAVPANSDDFDFAIAAGLHSTLSIPYAELMASTDQFSPSNVLGRGGYGVVFRGSWKHTPIAVKLIGGKQHRRSNAANNSSAERERLRQSLMELKTLSLYRHDNILPLYAYSLDGPEPCLVYQFMANGSLEDRLLCRNGTIPLTWSQRRTIVIGASRGLNFLHVCSREPLIHGDIKSANILLDAHYEAKIGDFGLSRRGVVEIPNNTSPLIASHIKGTLAYLPPEFLRCKHLSTKLDVYSFGVVLFEIATGLRAYSDTRKPENLVEFVRCQINSEHAKSVDTWKLFADCKTESEGAHRLVPQCIEMGQRCTSMEPSSRPCMKDVIEIFDAA